MNSSEFFSQPTAIDVYQNFTLLSQGGFNALYSVEREGKRFVVKALKEEYRGNTLYESLLRKEFEIGYSLDNHNICRIYSFEHFTETGNAIVMEWLDGRTLKEYIAEGGHSRQELTTIATQICSALSYAHKRQIIHRDIKPQNIIITYNGDNVKLLDFGLSLADYHTALTEPAGSRKYASPELQRGTEIDLRTDIYSLGIVIDELFEGHITRKISKIVTRATAYYPTSRYADADTLAAALNHRPRGVIYPILALIIIALGYLFYSTNQIVERSTQVLIPSAEVDGVSDEEFAHRQATLSKFYDIINRNYVELGQRLYKTNYASEQMPDFEALSRTQIAHYERILDSIMGHINSSSLYINAHRNMTSHNNELFTLMRNQLPAMFWINTEQAFKEASDPLARELKQRVAPKLDINYSEMSFDEQQAENERYQKATKEYKDATIRVWCEAYRKEHNLTPLPAQITSYYK